MKEELKPQPITLDQFKTMPDVTDEVTKAVYQVAKEITEKEDAFIIDTIYPWCKMQTAEISKEDLKDALRQWKRPAKWIYDEASCCSCCSACNFIKAGKWKDGYGYEIPDKYCPNCGRRMENGADASD